MAIDTQPAASQGRDHTGDQKRRPRQEVTGEVRHVQVPRMRLECRTAHAALDVVIPDEDAEELPVRGRVRPQKPRQRQGEDQRHAPPEGVRSASQVRRSEVGGQRSAPREIVSEHYGRGKHGADRAFEENAGSDSDVTDGRKPDALELRASHSALRTGEVERHARRRDRESQGHVDAADAGQPGEVDRGRQDRGGEKARSWATDAAAEPGEQ